MFPLLRKPSPSSPLKVPEATVFKWHSPKCHQKQESLSLCRQGARRNGRRDFWGQGWGIWSQKLLDDGIMGNNLVCCHAENRWREGTSNKGLICRFSLLSCIINIWKKLFWFDLTSIVFLVGVLCKNVRKGRGDQLQKSNSPQFKIKTFYMRGSEFSET